MKNIPSGNTRCWSTVGCVHKMLVNRRLLGNPGSYDRPRRRGLSGGRHPGISRCPGVVPPGRPPGVGGSPRGPRSSRAALRGTAAHQRYGGPFRPPRPPGRPAAGPAWVGPGRSAVCPGCAPGRPVPVSPAVGLPAARAAAVSGPSAPSAGGSGPLGLSAGRPPRRRGPGAPPSAPAAAWAVPAAGGPAAPAARSPGRLVVPAGLRCPGPPRGGRPWAAPPVRRALSVPRRVPLPGPLSGGPPKAWAAAPPPSGARGGRPGAALCAARAPPLFGVFWVFWWALESVS